MNYQVYWLPTAEDDLAEAWLQASDPNAVTVAQDQIDQLLARDPLGNGVHVREGLYRIIVAPLTAFYSVDTTQRQVEVGRVWLTP